MVSEGDPYQGTTLIILFSFFYQKEHRFVLAEFLHLEKQGTQSRCIISTFLSLNLASCGPPCITKKQYPESQTKREDRLRRWNRVG